jgi:hypothetical protein
MPHPLLVEFLFLHKRFAIHVPHKLQNLKKCVFETESKAITMVYNKEKSQNTPYT